MGRTIEGWLYWLLGMTPLLFAAGYAAVTGTLQPGEPALLLALLSGTAAVWSILLRGLDR